jgi:hypothetical protein
MQKDIRCPECDVLFGKEIQPKEGGQILTIKNRDLYRSMLGGKVWGPCRGCGTTVIWPERE